MRSQFADGTEVYANLGAAEATLRTTRWGEVRLPAHGLLAHTPDFLGLCVLAFGGRQYQEPTLFTVTSVDGQPLEKAARVRIFHGFGPAQLEFRGQHLEVPREKVVELGVPPASR